MGRSYACVYKPKYTSEMIILDVTQMQLLQTSSAGLPTWRRFRGLTPGPPLLSQVPPQLSKTVVRL